MCVWCVFSHFHAVRIVFVHSLTAPSSHQPAAILLVSDNQRPSFCRTANVKSIMVVWETRVSLRLPSRLLYYKSPFILLSLSPFFVLFFQNLTLLIFFFPRRPFRTIHFNSLQIQRSYNWHNRNQNIKIWECSSSNIIELSPLVKQDVAEKLGVDVEKIVRSCLRLASHCSCYLFCLIVSTRTD